MRGLVQLGDVHGDVSRPSLCSLTFWCLAFVAYPHGLVSFATVPEAEDLVPRLVLEVARGDRYGHAARVLVAGNEELRREIRDGVGTSSTSSAAAVAAKGAEGELEGPRLEVEGHGEWLPVDLAGVGTDGGGQGAAAGVGVVGEGHVELVAGEERQVLVVPVVAAPVRVPRRVVPEGERE